MSETNKATIRRMIDAFNRGEQESVLREIVADDFVDRTAPPGAPSDREAWIAMAAMFRPGFPDIHVDIVHLLADGDLVMAHESSTGTHTGSFMGVPATGRQATVATMHVFRFEGGQIVERWTLFDMPSLWMQLGVQPPAMG